MGKSRATTKISLSGWGFILALTVIMALVGGASVYSILVWAAMGRVYADLDIQNHIIDQIEYTRRIAEYQAIDNYVGIAVIVWLLIWAAGIGIIMRVKRTGVQ